MAKIVAIAGAGTMGAGIAQVASQAGWKVRLFDAAPDAARKGKQNIETILNDRVEKGKLDALGREVLLARIDVVNSLEEAIPGIDLFLEAVLEDIAVKRDLFGKVTQLASPEAILATNTSSLSVTAIAAATSRPDKVVGMHFFNPAPVMKLVEIIQGDSTSEETMLAATGIAEAWGKTPATAKDTPGFIVNRIARSYYGEALRMLGEHIGDVEAIDRIMTGVGAFKMGPFRLLDLVGIDVNLAVTKSVYHAFFEEARFRPHPIQQKMVDAGLLGRKTRKGFYTYGA